MNWKKIFTIAALTGFSASVATGQGTAPTIIQGDYISNVFGQSNFIKNPNAKLNTKDVTVSNATVSRSISTPLVATSEFTVAIGTANGTATWATRAFDAGMKGQNCEARFSYRGFAATSKVHIKQGANTVASLNLTPATDPRIASINFPCGDLSTATTFVVTDTAILAGTNEIGAIYTGLATNQANVAQAEMIGGVDFSTTIAAAVTGAASYWTNFTGSAGTATPVGKATSATTNLTVTFASLPAGEYQVQIPIMFFVFGGTGGHSCRFGIKEETSGQVIYLNQAGSTGAGAGLYVSMPGPTPVRFTFTGAATTRTFRIVAGNTGWTASANGSCFVESQSSNANGYGIYVYRFPTSSELVVTPERQNTFAGVQYSASSDFAATGTATDTKINTTNFGTPTGFGKAQVTSLTDCGLVANDIGFCVKNVPPGTYMFTSNIQVGAGYSFGTPGATACAAHAFVSGTSLSATRISSTFTTVNISNDEGWTIMPSGIVTVPSFQSNLAVYLAYGKSASTGRCVVRSSQSAQSASLPSFSLVPLDQPSNSALYVQGPVKSAGTGDTIAIGFQGSIISNVGTSLTGQSQGVDKTGTGITLQPGYYFMMMTYNVGVVAPTKIACGFTTTVNGSPINDATGQPSVTQIIAAGNTAEAVQCKSSGYFKITTATTLYPTGRTFTPTSSGYSFSYEISGFMIN